jgi:hypothetical protein
MRVQLMAILCLTSMGADSQLPPASAPLGAGPLAHQEAPRTQTKGDGSVSALRQTAKPNPDLHSLNRLVGKWNLCGDVEGQVTYEWMNGGFFLVQHFDFKRGGRTNKGIEVIGHVHRLGTKPGKEIRSRVYSFPDGLTLDYGIRVSW